MERNAEAYQGALRLIGVEVGEDEVFVNEGLRSGKLIERLARAHGLVLPIGQLAHLTREHQRIFTSFGVMPLYPDAAATVRMIHRASIRTALVTANERENAVRNLAPILPMLDVVVTAEDVTNSKPDPEPYRVALAKLEVPPTESVVVENSPLGILSAKAAGINVVAITTTNSVQRLSLADSVIGSLVELPNALAELGWKVDTLRGISGWP
ncbi:MAG: HAD family phosphatase [Thermoplasmata archaeon]